MRNACTKCGAPTPGMLCDECRGRALSVYSSADWHRRSREFLRDNPTCSCGKPAQVADHYPLTRWQLIAMGVEDPDARNYLRARCAGCHNRQSPLQAVRMDNDPA